MSTFPVLPLVKSKPHRRKARSSRPHSRWPKSILTLERLENRALPSTLSFTATNRDFTDYINEPVATPMPIPQFDTLGGLRTLKSVEIISNIEIDTSASGTITNRSAQPLTYEGMVTNATISVTGTGLSSPLSATNPTLLDTGAINCLGRTTTTIGPFSASLTAMGDVTLTSASDLAAFIGTGNISYTNSAGANSSNVVTGGSNFLNNVAITAIGSATVEVIYTFVTNPSLVTTASPAVTLGTTAPTLSDSLVLSRGTSPTGSITFHLTGPGGFNYTQTDTVLGNRTYTAGVTLPTSGTVAGTYTWSASYSGDSNNSGTADEGGTAEETTVKKATPSLRTTASPSFTLGTTAPVLSDSAVLSGGFFETGTITFTLTGPGGFSYTQTDSVHGNGNYTAGDTLPTTGLVAGTYIWSAHYSGDANNVRAADQGGIAETAIVSAAHPTMVTTASGDINLPTTASALTDSAVISGGFFESGTITFTLTGPGGFTYTQMDTVSGNGNYAAGVTLPTTGLVAGTYTWSAHYSGDGNNAGSNDQGGPAEMTRVSLASPGLVTAASPSFTLGSTAPTLTDSAVISGGFFETGSITFTLTGPGGFSYTQTDTVDGNGTYTAGDKLPATGIVAGTYTWSAHYSGDGNNSGFDDLGGVTEQTVVGFVASSRLSLSGATSVMAGASYNLTVTVNESATDTLTSLTVNWDDGSTETIALPPLQFGSFILSHQYASGPAFHMISATFAGQDGVHDANTVPLVVLVPGLEDFATAISTPGDPGTANVTGQIQGTLTLPPGLTLSDLGLLLVGTYSGNPKTQTPQGSAVQFFDIEAELHVAGNPGDATLTVLFSVPDGSDPKHLVPQFFDGKTWRPISGATISVVVDANGHQFVELTLSSHTFPNITQLGGTVFTVAVTTQSTTNTVIFPPLVAAPPLEVIEPNFAAPATFVTSSQLTLTLAASPESAGSSGSDDLSPQGDSDILRSLQWLMSPESLKGTNDDEIPAGQVDPLRSQESDKQKRLSEPAKNDGGPTGPPKPSSHGPTDQPPTEQPPAPGPDRLNYLRLPDDDLRLPDEPLNIVLAASNLDELDFAAAIAQADPHASGVQTANSQLAIAALAIGAMAREWSADEEERRPY